MPQRLFTIGSPAQLGLGDLLARFVQGFVCKAIEETQSHRKEARHTCSKMGPRATQPFYLLEETQGHWKEARHKSSFAQLKKPRVPGKKYDINVPKMGPRAARLFDSIEETQTHWKEARPKCSKMGPQGVASKVPSQGQAATGMVVAHAFHYCFLPQLRLGDLLARL